VQFAAGDAAFILATCGDKKQLLIGSPIVHEKRDREAVAANSAKNARQAKKRRGQKETSKQKKKKTAVNDADVDVPTLSVVYITMDSMSRDMFHTKLPRVASWLHRQVERTQHRPQREARRRAAGNDGDGDGGGGGEAYEPPPHEWFDFRLFSIIGDGTPFHVDPLLRHDGMWKWRRGGDGECDSTAKQSQFLWDEFRRVGYATSLFFSHDNLVEFFCAGYGALTHLESEAALQLMAKEFGYNPWHTHGHCAGDRYLHEYALEHVERLLDLYTHRRVRADNDGNGGDDGGGDDDDAAVPVFAHVHVMNAHEETGSMAASLDRGLLEFLSTVDLNATAVVLLGDHGPRFSMYRQSLAAMSSSRLPAFYMSLPRWATSRSQAAALRTNQRRLLTVRDIRATLRDVVFSAASSRGRDMPNAYDTPVDAAAAAAAASPAETPHHLRHSPYASDALGVGISLLRPIPAARTCANAGIPLAFCLCVHFQPLALPNAAAAVDGGGNGGTLPPPEVALHGVADGTALRWFKAVASEYNEHAKYGKYSGGSTFVKLGHGERLADRESGCATFALDTWHVYAAAVAVVNDETSVMEETRYLFKFTNTEKMASFESVVGVFTCRKDRYPAPLEAGIAGFPWRDAATGDIKAPGTVVAHTDTLTRVDYFHRTSMYSQDKACVERANRAAAGAADDNAFRKRHHLGAGTPNAICVCDGESASSVARAGNAGTEMVYSQNQFEFETFVGDVNNRSKRARSSTKRRPSTPVPAAAAAIAAGSGKGVTMKKIDESGDENDDVEGDNASDVALLKEIAASPFQLHIFADYDIKGNDIGHRIAVRTLAACMNACFEHSRCNSLVFRRTERVIDRSCWLKTAELTESLSWPLNPAPKGQSFYAARRPAMSPTIDGKTLVVAA
jgi:hypothetical protein